jgi:alkylated DNA nucleotide flippase Atl1
MKAQETTFQQIIEGEKQFQVPLYQRTYSWQEAELHQLWDDVLDQADGLTTLEPGPTHFLGSVVLAPSPALGPAGVMKWIVVDGQQRLTTLMLAMCALRDHLAAGNPRERNRIDELYLTNKWRSRLDFYRLLPTQSDRDAFFACINRMPGAGGGDNIGAAYRFFRRELVAADDEEDPHDLERIETVLRERLTLVAITTHPDDNVHRIFESLNNTGLKLSQGDLLRNYVFMLLPTRAEHVYATYWRPMQERLGEHLELLFYLDLILRGAERAKRVDVYRGQVQRLEPVAKDEAALEHEVAELARRARHLELIVHPTGEQHPGIRAALQWLNAWGAQTTYPLVMHLLDLRDHERASDEQLARTLIYVESFLVRRMLCAVPTNNLNRIFNGLVQQLPEGLPIDDAVRHALSGPRRFWPSDATLQEAIRTKPFYWQGRPEQRVVVLRRLEESYPSKERVDFAASRLSIEHILPQTPTKEWLDVLTAEAGDELSPEELHQQLVHTLGNLTLTGYNVELSNHPFERKQELFAKSHLELNRIIAETPRWGRTEILHRADDLARRAIDIWPGPLTGGGLERLTGRDWSMLHQALTALPAGSWTTYGDLAELVGSHPRAVSRHLASVGAVNAHRVLARDGSVAPTFPRRDEQGSRDSQDLLRSEGIRLDDTLTADPAQRMSAQDLADLLGLTEEEEREQEPARPGHRYQDAPGRSELRESFLAQLGERQPQQTVYAVQRLLEHWVALGGVLGFGKARETSCFLLLRGPEGAGGYDWWPFALYPSGTCEIVFQHLLRRPPFDDEGLREEFRERCSRASGIDIPRAKLRLRPSFPLSVLADDTARERVFAALEWFVLASRASTTTAANGQQPPVGETE